MRWGHGHPIDSSRNSDEDDEQKESNCAIRIVSRVGSTTSIRWARGTIIVMAGQIGGKRRR